MGVESYIGDIILDMRKDEVNKLLSQVDEKGKLTKEAKTELQKTASDLPIELKDEHKLMINIIKALGKEAFGYASLRLQGKKEFIIDAIKIDTSIIGNIDAITQEQLFKQTDFVFVIAEIETPLLVRATEKMRENRELAYIAVSKFGPILKIFPKFQDDDEIVMIAAKNRKHSLTYASKRLQEKYKNITEEL